MDFRLRSRLISLAVLLVGVLISGLLFFLSWALGRNHPWVTWLMPLSYAAFLGCALIAFLIQLGTHYNFPRNRVIGFMLVIIWIGASLLTTTLDTLTFLSEHVTQGISYAIVIGGLVILVLPGFLLILFPWPPKFLEPRKRPEKAGYKTSKEN